MVVREKSIELPLRHEEAIPLCGDVLAALGVKKSRSGWSGGPRTLPGNHALLG